jgi:hypothetical protein
MSFACSNRIFNAVKDILELHRLLLLLYVINKFDKVLMRTEFPLHYYIIFTSWILRYLNFGTRNCFSRILFP